MVDIVIVKQAPWSKNMSQYTETKYFTKELLLDAIDAAKRENRSRIIQKERIMNCDDNFIFVVHQSYYHNKNEMRLFISIDYTANIHIIDVGMARYNSLPISKTDSDGIVYLESLEDTDKRQPYGKGREFEEKVRIKPLRKSKFRKIVTEAYGNQCALCTISNPLVAAHIVPVANGGRDTIDNGILLCRNHDHLFEFGKIRISPDGGVACDRDDMCETSRIRYPNNIKFHPSPDNFKRKLALLTEKDSS